MGLEGRSRARVWKVDTFEAAARLIAEDQRPPLVLDFASDSNPGGGCKGNQQGTQEESLCRQSSLFPSLEKQTYPIPRLGCIYAPDICVFRGPEKEGYLLRTDPFWVSVVAATLPNCGSELDRPQRSFLADKISSVLNVAIQHNHNRLVLGAWGCGAFGNDARDIAEIFRTSLSKVDGLDVVFAVTGHNFEAFKAVLDMEEDSEAIGLDAENDEVPLIPPELQRDLSAMYESRGASLYDEVVLERWKVHRDLAAAAGAEKKWSTMATELRLCLEMRPDWAQGYVGLHAALAKSCRGNEAWAALHDGNKVCLSNIRQIFERGLSPQSIIDGCFMIMDKVEKQSKDHQVDFCEALGLTTQDQEGIGTCLYRRMESGVNCDAAPAKAIDEAAVIMQVQTMSSSEVTEMTSRHGANLRGIADCAQKWIEDELGSAGHIIVERLKQDAAGDQSTYYSWCIRAKLVIEGVRSCRDEARAQTLLEALPGPLRLLFLDVDGVLNAEIPNSRKIAAPWFLSL
jgi:uncharacterized protein (TIGR02452 family)